MYVHVHCAFRPPIYTIQRSVHLYTRMGYPIEYPRPPQWMTVWMHLLGALHQVQDVDRMSLLGWAGGRPGHGVLTYKCK